MEARIGEYDAREVSDAKAVRELDVRCVVSDRAGLPAYAHDGDAGLDLCVTEDVELAPGETRKVGTGVSVEIPEGYVGLVFPRSGLGTMGLTLANAVGVVDSGFRGEIQAPLHNNNPTMTRTTDEFGNTFYHTNHDTIKVAAGTRVCQLVVVPFVRVRLVPVDQLGESERGDNGFGSSGVL